MADTQPKPGISPRERSPPRGRAEHQWGCPNSGLATSLPRVQVYPSPPPKQCPPLRYRAACGHGLQGRPGTRTRSVPELVERVSRAERNKDQRRVPGAGVCWPTCPQSRQLSDTPWDPGETHPRVGGRGGSGEGTSQKTCRAPHHLGTPLGCHLPHLPHSH